MLFRSALVGISILLGLHVPQLNAEEASQPLLEALRRTTISGYSDLNTVWNPSNGTPVSWLPATEILWEHADGRHAIWNVTGTALHDGRLVRLFGVTELLGYWNLSNIHRQNNSVFIGNQPIAYRSSFSVQQLQFGGEADITGDGYPDIVWNYGNWLVVWEMQGYRFVKEHIVGQIHALRKDARIAAVADFTGDHHPELLWQDSGGKLLVTPIQRLTFGRAFYLYDGKAANPLWRLSGTGDFNHDGQADILWHHEDGRVAAWFMDGPRKVGVALLRDGKPTGPGWRINDTRPVYVATFIPVVHQLTPPQLSGINPISQNPREPVYVGSSGSVNTVMLPNLSTNRGIIYIPAPTTNTLLPTNIIRYIPSPPLPPLP